MKVSGFSLAAAVLAITAPGVSPAQDKGMTVGTFLSKVDALKKKGPLAMFSPDIALIKQEMRTAATQLKAEGDARKAAGKPPIACPPKDRKGQLGADEFMKTLQQIPPAKRGISLKDGLAYVIVTKYPCKG